RAAYLVPADAHPNYVKLNGYPLSLFYANLAKLKARSATAIIDSCFSGASHKGMLVSRASPLVLSAAAPEPAAGVDVFTSASGQEISSWYEEKGHSLFTYYLLKAVQDGAKAGRTLTNAEVRDALGERVPVQARRLFGRIQTPAFSGAAQASFLGAQ
ncbi:MAG: caspase family protein, partial [Elusimicrobia bacterium]|nr:caspase family protein [Elusimicrobiota bacterium]